MHCTSALEEKSPEKRRDRVPAIVTKVHGTRSVNVRVIPRGPTWRRYLDQLRPRHFQPGLTTHLVLLRTNATIRDYQPETSAGDTIHDDQQGQKNFQKNIVANTYIYFFVVVLFLNVNWLRFFVNINYCCLINLCIRAKIQQFGMCANALEVLKAYVGKAAIVNNAL